MKREEAIKVLAMFLHKQCDLKRTEFAYDDNTVWEAVYMASKALEQEPVLDKIRDEIEQIELLASHTRGDIKQIVLDIIDKYRGYGMSRSLLHDRESDIERCCRENLPCEMAKIAEDIYQVAYLRGRNSIDTVTILDNIRAEIDQEYTKFRNKSDMWDERACGLGTALEIIDKCRGEET